MWSVHKYYPAIFIASDTENINVKIALADFDVESSTWFKTEGKTFGENEFCFSSVEEAKTFITDWWKKELKITNPNLINITEWKMGID